MNMEKVEKIVKNAQNIFGTTGYLRNCFLRAVNEGKPEVERREGGYLVVLADAGPGNSDPDLPVVVIALGEIRNEKRKKYHTLALKKAHLIHGRDGVLSSWQCYRNPNAKYGGAIRVPGFTLSFAGFPEAINEVFVLLVATASGLITTEAAREYTVHSGNHELYLSYLAQIAVQILQLDI